jgi:hypothetical protein
MLVQGAEFVSTTPLELLHWQKEISKNLPGLSKPVLRVLGLMSFAMVYVRHCGRCQLSCFLAEILVQKAKTIEQCLYQWCCLKEPHTGCPNPRPDWNVRDCFAPLLSWIVRLWKSHQIALVLDATTLYDQFTILTVSVVFREIGIPVAWKVFLAKHKQPWQAEWVSLITLLQSCIPADWTVLVLADRGLYAKWLFECIMQANWHPCMRVNGQGCFKPDGAPAHTFGRTRYLRDFVPEVGTYYATTGIAFSGANQLACTVLCCWDPAYTDPWIIITDLAPNDCHIAWYALRCWCEQGFKCIKRGSWQWQYTRMHDPQRAERLWLAIAVATLWCVAVGAQVEDDLTDSQLYTCWLKSADQPDCPRVLRLLKIGANRIVANVLRHLPLPIPLHLTPSPWPAFSLTRNT